MPDDPDKLSRRLKKLARRVAKTQGALFLVAYVLFLLIVKLKADGVLSFKGAVPVDG